MLVPCLDAPASRRCLPKLQRQELLLRPQLKILPDLPQWHGGQQRQQHLRVRVRLDLQQWRVPVPQGPPLLHLDRLHRLLPAQVLRQRPPRVPDLPPRHLVLHPSANLREGGLRSGQNLQLDRPHLSMPEHY